MVEKTDDLLPEERKFAEEVARLRKSVGWTQAHMASLLVEQGVVYMTQSTVSRVEKFQRPARVGEAEAWALIFGRDTYRLMHPTPIDDMVEQARFNARKLAQAWGALDESMLTYARVRGDLDGTITDLRELVSDPSVDEFRQHELRSLVDHLQVQRDIEDSVPDLFSRYVRQEAADGKHPTTF